MKTVPIYGMMAEFDSAKDLVVAARRTHGAGYKKIDAYSPFPVIGWASVLADSSGGLLIVMLLAEMYGVWRYSQSGPREAEARLPRERTWERRTLLGGGTLLVLLGFLYGAWYAGADLYRHEAQETTILKHMVDGAVSPQGGSTLAVADYGSLAAERAVTFTVLFVKIAAPSA